MSTAFNPLSFLRRISIPLLQQFFAPFPAFADFEWTQVTRQNIDLVMTHCDRLPAGERAQVVRVFRQIESLGNSIGTQVLLNAARDEDPALLQQISAEMQTKRNGHERAMWFYLKNAGLFQAAHTLAHIDNLPKRYWEPRKNLPKCAIQVTAEMLGELSQQLAQFFWSTQVRGDKCKVEHRCLDGDIEMFFAYPADYPEERFCYDDEGQFDYRHLNPAFEVVFRYHRADGTTDIFGQGGKEVREALAQIFTRVALGVESQPEPIVRDCFNLALFKNPEITFPTKTADNLSLRVKAIQVAFDGRTGGRITFETDGRRKDGSAYDILAETLNERHRSLTAATVPAVTLQAFYRSDGKARSCLFRVTPSNCDLDDSPMGQMLRQYLRVWGIETNVNGLATAA